LGKNRGLQQGIRGKRAAERRYEGTKGLRTKKGAERRATGAGGGRKRRGSSKKPEGKKNKRCLHALERPAPGKETGIETEKKNGGCCPKGNLGIQGGSSGEGCGRM